MTSLPSQPDIETMFSNHSSIASISSVYHTCLDAESRATDPKSMIYARVVGYIMLYSPSETARAEVVRSVVSCQTNNDLYKLGGWYYRHFICPFKKYSGRTPARSPPISRPSSSFDTIRDMINATLVQDPKSHVDAKTNALIRDGHRCAVTGKYDVDSVMANTELRDEMCASVGSAMLHTHCAHIFPEFGNRSFGDEKKLDHADSIWAVLSRFGYGDILEELNGAGIHQLENVMTLSADVRECFDRLEVWFEETEIDNHHNVKYAEQGNKIFEYTQLPSTVTFRAHRPDLPLPSPTYLRIHAACAKVAHLSGAGEAIDEMYRDMESMIVLASDGSSADVLSHLLHSLEDMSQIPKSGYDWCSRSGI